MLLLLRLSSSSSSEATFEKRGQRHFGSHVGLSVRSFVYRSKKEELLAASFWLKLD